ncbi:MAG: hypothetical protein AB8B61_10020 [Cyclobacteriaceae bacterium]
MIHKSILFIVLSICCISKSISQQQLVKIDTNLFLQHAFIKENTKKYFKQYKPTFREKEDHFMITGFFPEVSTTTVTHLNISSRPLSDSTSKVILLYEPEATTQHTDANFKNKVATINEKLLFFLKQEDVNEQLKAAEIDLLTASKVQLRHLRKKEALYKEAFRKDKEITQWEEYLRRSIDDCHTIYLNIDSTSNLLDKSTNAVYLKKKQLETLKKKAFDLKN